MIRVLDEADNLPQDYYETLYRQAFHLLFLRYPQTLNNPHRIPEQGCKYPFRIFHIPSSAEERTGQDHNNR